MGKNSEKISHHLRKRKLNANSGNVKENEFKIKEWFDNLIAELNNHRDMLLTNTARRDLKDLYDRLIFGNKDDALLLGLKNSASYIILDIIVDYLKEIIVRKKLNLESISVNLSGLNKILLWIVINNNDEKTEDQLILSEAKINAEYYKYGFSISSMIVEKSDEISIPSQYNRLYP